MNLKQLRILILVGALFMMSFMVADLPLLPEAIHEVYIISRVALQLPILSTFVLLTFLPIYPHIHDKVLCIALLSISYVNYWVTIQSWQILAFSFPYEGVLLYALYASFILRLSFRYTLAYTICSALGFCGMVLIWPIYGEFTGVKIGFV